MDTETSMSINADRLIENLDRIYTLENKVHQN